MKNIQHSEISLAQTLSQQLGIRPTSSPQLIHALFPALSNCQLSIKRDDLLHPIISGNKWRKLKYSLCDAKVNNIQHIISFGGGYSNHLHALGYCCQQLNIKFSAIVRGDYSANLSPMLNDLISWHSDIHYVDKLTYQRRDKSDYLSSLQQRYPNALIVPEGGSNKRALQGIAEIVSELQQRYDYIVAPVASGATLAGLIQATRNTPTKVVGIGVLKGQGYLETLVQSLLPQTYSHWSICHDYHFGGYAKRSEELTEFCDHFFQQTLLEIEPVYSGKLFYGLCDLVAKGYFPTNSKILALHTGGLQGARN